jgi:hypothetical protein
VQLQDAKSKFEKQGIKLAAISYDSPAILRDFAIRYTIEFPLLADPDSKIIRSFRVLNHDAKGMAKGMAHPGFFYIDQSGVIREKYFEAIYTNRFTANNVIGKLFPELAQEVSQNVEAPHLQLTVSQSDRTVVAGSRVSLTVEVQLPPGVHVYAPTVQGYKPIRLVLHHSGGFEAAPAIYPEPRVLYLDAVKERLPVYEGKFRIIQDVTVSESKAADSIRAVLSKDKKVSITGELQYQACSVTFCFLPTLVPVKWELNVQPLDLHRSPSDIRHK